MGFSSPPPPQPPESPHPPHPPFGQPRPAPGRAAQGLDPTVRIVIGLFLVVPALVALVVGHVGPTLWTWQAGFQKIGPIQQGEPENVGLANFQQVLERGLVKDAAFALSLGVVPLLAVLVAAPILAYAAHRAGRAGRWTVRLALTLPMVAFVPAAVAAGTRLGEATGAAAGSGSLLTDPGKAPFAVLLGVGLATGVLALGWAVTAFLAAFRRLAAADETWPAVLTVAGLGAITVVAAALQVFSMPYVMTAGGPARSTMTPMLEVLMYGFQSGRLGPGAAVSTVVLVILMVLGVGATAIVAFTRVRIELGPARAVDEVTGWPGVRVLALIVTILGSIAGLAVAFNLLRVADTPWLSRLGGTATAVPAPDVFGNTWGPTFLSAVIGVAIAAVAGFGIGALRPLGRFSELLLLPFAPWLFVGLGPLVLAHFVSARESETLNTFGALVPPVWVVVPALFVFTVLFRGLREEPLGQAIVSALPMIGLVGMVTWFVQAQDLFWPLAVATDQEHHTGPVAVAMLLGRFGTPVEGSPLGLAMPVFLLAGFALVLAAAHLFYLDRLSIRVGRE